MMLCHWESGKAEAFNQDLSSTVWRTEFMMVTVRADASSSSSNSNKMLRLARTYKSAHQLCSVSPRPSDDVHTVLVPP
jgi:hypothetical protein